jgi:oligoribonuclease (3'-5' exoribonuclease)
MRMATTKEKAPKVIRQGPRPLRRELLVKAARAELGRMTNLSPKTDPINMLRLATRLKVTRQALYNNNLGPVVAEYAELQRKNFSTAVAAASLRRPLEERIRELEKENQELRQKLDGWIERWVTVEYNARLCGNSADKLFEPIQPPQRKTLAFRKGRKARE